MSNIRRVHFGHAIFCAQLRFSVYGHPVRSAQSRAHSLDGRVVGDLSADVQGLREDLPELKNEEM